MLHCKGSVIVQYVNRRETGRTKERGREGKSVDRLYAWVKCQNCVITLVSRAHRTIRIDKFHKSQNAPVPHPRMLHSEQKCAHFCSEWSILGYATGAFWDLWIRSNFILSLTVSLYPLVCMESKGCIWVGTILDFFYHLPDCLTFFTPIPQEATLTDTSVIRTVHGGNHGHT